MHSRSHGDEGPDGFRVQERPLGVLLRGDAELFEGVSSEEGVASLVPLARPVECGFEHAKVPPNRVGSDTTACCAPVTPPYHVVVNSIWGKLAHQLTVPEELREIPTSLSNVL